MDLYASTGGDGWGDNGGWGTGDPCAQMWSRVFCNPGLTEITRMLVYPFRKKNVSDT